MDVLAIGEFDLGPGRPGILDAQVRVLLLVEQADARLLRVRHGLHVDPGVVVLHDPLGRPALTCHGEGAPLRQSDAVAVASALDDELLRRRAGIRRRVWRRGNARGAGPRVQTLGSTGGGDVEGVRARRNLLALFVAQIPGHREIGRGLGRCRQGAHGISARIGDGHRRLNGPVGPRGQGDGPA